ncbi:hypothetical protein [Nocardioides zeae]|uniref:Uncharacterized protein n=1 Tax=Nocardioides zeae TaxID=1457234 RepID=A0AAJ1U3C0_9ACTN|nr:hypothetical protein [Nocardioides zeae]MDQ1106835.1 hypothetical protein [Nocardioides zeae]
MSDRHPADDPPIAPGRPHGTVAAGAPVTAGDTSRRWHRSVWVGALATALVVAGGAIALRVVDLGSTRDGAADGAADRTTTARPGAGATYALTVRTAVVTDAPIAYDEGALIKIALDPTTPGVATPRHRGPADVDSPAAWTDLAAGSYVMTVATRPCHGNCSMLDPAMDACHSTVDLDADAEVLVSIEWGRPCVIAESGP